MGELALRNLHGSGAEKVTVINRTIKTAEDLAGKFGGVAKSMAELQCSLLETDILISSTSSTDYVLDFETMKYVERLRKGNPIFLIDIAVPRDLDPRIGDLPNVFLYDIDDLQGIVDANLAERERAAVDINRMIEGQVLEFNEWLVTLGVVPVITALREKALGIQATTMESILNKMPDLTEREIKVLSKHTKSIINQLLKDPIQQVKELAGELDSSEKLELFQQVFGIDEETLKVKERQSNLSRELIKDSEQRKNSVDPNLAY